MTLLHILFAPNMIWLSKVYFEHFNFSGVSKSDMENHKLLKVMSASATCHFCPCFTGWIRSPGHFWILYCRDIYTSSPERDTIREKKSKYLVKSMPNLLSSILSFWGRLLENKIFIFSVFKLSIGIWYAPQEERASSLQLVRDHGVTVLTRWSWAGNVMTIV